MNECICHVIILRDRSLSKSSFRTISPTALNVLFGEIFWRAERASVKNKITLTELQLNVVKPPHSTTQKLLYST